MLNKRRQSGMGHNPIAYSEIMAYAALHDIVLMSWEIELIHLFDDVVLEVYAKEESKQTTKAATKSKK